MPSGTVLSHFRLCVDVSYARVVSAYFRKLMNLGEDVALYFVCDSSPRAGRDWFLAEFWCISVKALIEIIQLQDEIIALRAARAEGEDIVDGDSSLLAEKSKTMCALIWHHILVPVALGFGLQGLHQQFIALLHAFRTEADLWELVQFLARCIVSITTDFGTESGLYKVPALDVNDLF